MRQFFPAFSCLPLRITIARNNRWRQTPSTKGFASKSFSLPSPGHMWTARRLGSLSEHNWAILSAAPFDSNRRSGAHRRREGGVAQSLTISAGTGAAWPLCNLSFSGGPLRPGQDFPTFPRLSFSRRLDRYISTNRDKFSVVNIHAPAGLVYGIHRRWFGSATSPLRNDSSRPRGAPHSCAKPRSSKRPRLEFFFAKPSLASLLHFSALSLGHPHCRRRRTHTAATCWNMLQLKYNLDSDRSAYIPNGVEPRFFPSAPLRSSWSFETPLCGHVARPARHFLSSRRTRTPCPTIARHDNDLRRLRLPPRNHQGFLRPQTGLDRRG